MIVETRGGKCWGEIYGVYLGDEIGEMARPKHTPERAGTQHMPLFSIDSV